LDRLASEGNMDSGSFVERGRPLVDPGACAPLARAAMAETDSPPDRLSLDPRSDYFDETLLSRGVGIRFNGQEKTSVIEYCISEGWIRVAAGKSRDRYGQPMTLKLSGKVEPYFETPADEGQEDAKSED
jgi:hypothetical protein